MIDNRYKILSVSTCTYKPLLEEYPALKSFNFEPEEDIECESVMCVNYGGSIELNTMNDIRRLMHTIDSRLILETIDRSPFDIPEHIIIIYDGYIE